MAFQQSKDPDIYSHDSMACVRHRRITVVRLTTLPAPTTTGSLGVRLGPWRAFTDRRESGSNVDQIEPQICWRLVRTWRCCGRVNVNLSCVSEDPMLPKQLLSHVCCEMMSPAAASKREGVGRGVRYARAEMEPNGWHFPIWKTLDRVPVTSMEASAGL